MIKCHNVDVVYSLNFSISDAAFIQQHCLFEGSNYFRIIFLKSLTANSNKSFVNIM